LGHDIAEAEGSSEAGEDGEIAALEDVVDVAAADTVEAQPSTEGHG
jgi:hypothetical protein